MRSRLNHMTITSPARALERGKVSAVLALELPACLYALSVTDRRAAIEAALVDAMEPVLELLDSVAA